MSRAARLRIGTRGSALAFWQARHVEALIRALPGAPDVALIEIKTEGDLRNDVPLWAVQGRAFFTKEIDRALLTGEVDLAVHSLKDLSTLMDAGLDLAAVLKREDPRDALLARDGYTLASLPPNARVGTSSLRRRAFLAHARPDLELLELRGNVPTRIEKLRAGHYDAIVLAAAGLARLQLTEYVTEWLPAAVFPPAVSQGAIGVCARAQDEATLRWLHSLDHTATRLATTAERALLRRIEGGCQVPLGALAQLTNGVLSLDAAVCSLDGRECLRSSGERPATAGEARLLGQQVADALLHRGAGRLVAAQRGAQVAVPES